MKTGAELITEERQRQIEVEGWTPEHDKEHFDDSMAFAAAAYAIPHYSKIDRSDIWPWEQKWWKPTPDNRIRELQKAGALIAAEIDRLQGE